MRRDDFSAERHVEKAELVSVEITHVRAVEDRQALAGLAFIGCAQLDGAGVERSTPSGEPPGIATMLPLPGAGSFSSYGVQTASIPPPSSEVP